MKNSNKHFSQEILKEVFDDFFFSVKIKIFSVLFIYFRVIWAKIHKALPKKLLETPVYLDEILVNVPIESTYPNVSSILPIEES